MNDLLTTHAPKALAALRIMAGLLFVQHGTQKLFGFPVAEFQPEAFTLLWWGAVIEVIGGAALVLGFLTRPVAFLASGTMAVAYFMFHAPGGFFPALNGGDAAILFSFVFVYFVFSGPGAWAVDNLRSTGGAHQPA